MQSPPRVAIAALAACVLAIGGRLGPARADPPVEAVTVNANVSKVAGSDSPTEPADASQPASVIGRTALSRYVAPDRQL